MCSDFYGVLVTVKLMELGLTPASPTPTLNSVEDVWLVDAMIFNDESTVNACNTWVELTNDTVKYFK